MTSRIRNRILDSSEEDEESSSSSDSSDEAEEIEEDQPVFSSKAKTKYKIPKYKGNEDWTLDQLTNFRKIYPHLKNLDDSILKKASLKDISTLGKQKTSNGKFINQAMTANFENLLNFPEQIPAGLDDCTGKRHMACFLRGYVGDGQDLWVQAREVWGPEGIDPICNYEVVSMGLGDLLTPKVWAIIHRPNARDLSITLLSQGSVEDAWKVSERSDSPKEFVTLLDFKMAMVTLEGAIHKVMPWNFAFKTVYIFMVSIDFGETELSGKPFRLQFLSNFVDEAIRANARNWEEKKKFLSHQDLCMKWTSHLTRKGALLKQPHEGKSREKPDGRGGGESKDRKRVPSWVCRAFNEGKCPSKDDRHASDWNPNYFLKHVCNRWVQGKNKHCLEAHKRTEHK